MIWGCRIISINSFRPVPNEIVDVNALRTVHKDTKVDV